jgi:putative nucleotidyltransferase with HDIG domain
LVVGLSHWITPTTHHYLHAFHVIFRKLFVVPIVLAAIWFEIRGSLLAAVIISGIYIPHIFLQWSGQTAENINQVGEMASLWIIAVLSGIFVKIEKNALREVAKTHEGTLISLVSALDAREHDTELHSLRVREYALRLAAELDLGAKEKEIIGKASLLHDIGKVGTPDHILLKKEALTRRERAVIQQHVDIGYRILRAVPFLNDAAEIVFSHHERYDGNGYPRGRKGEQIPLGARIFAVADVFDALTSDRPYRKKITCSEAREVIRKERERHFAPEVVDAFLRIPCAEWVQIDHHLSQRIASQAPQSDALATGTSLIL